jgi:hypothetical protein
LPGIADAAAVSDLPMGWQYSGSSFEIDGPTVAPSLGTWRAHYIDVSPSYFGTLGIPVLLGRGFLESDGPRSNGRHRQRPPGGSWRARTHRSTDQGHGTWRRVVGVARGAHAGPHDIENQIYLPYRQTVVGGTRFLVVRTSVPPETEVAAIRGLLRSLDPGVPAFEIRTMKGAFDRETATPRLPAVLTTMFGTLATLLAGLGLFGVVAYWVLQRTRKLGIRSALGARRGAAGARHPPGGQSRWRAPRQGSSVPASQGCSAASCTE